MSSWTAPLPVLPKVSMAYTSPSCQATEDKANEYGDNLKPTLIMKRQIFVNAKQTCMKAQSAWQLSQGQNRKKMSVKVKEGIVVLSKIFLKGSEGKLNQ